MSTASPIYGLDVSHFRAGIDLTQAYTEGMRFAFGKVGQGASVGQGFGQTLDSEWPAFRIAIAAAGLALGGYWYLGDSETPTSQATRARSWIGDPNIPLALDWELGGGDWANLLACLTAFRASGLWVRFLYTRNTYHATNGGGQIDGLDLTLWNARYPTSGGGTPQALYAPVAADVATYWQSYGGVTARIVQFSDAATIGGETPCDANAFDGDAAELAALFAEDDQMAEIEPRSPLTVPTPTAGGHAVRKDYADARAVPAGGATGQILSKVSATSYDTVWINPPVPSSRQISTGTGLAGGGDLSANRTLSVTYGTTAGTALEGSMRGASGGVAELVGTVIPRSRYQYANTTQDGTIVLTGDLGGTATAPTVPGLAAKVATSRTVSAGTGLTGGGDLSANRSFAVTYGTAADTAAQGNDARLSDARTPVAHNHPTSEITSGVFAIARIPVGTTTGTVTAGDDSRLVGAAPLLSAMATKTANYTLADVDQVVVFDTTTGVMTATLPTAVGRAGRRFLIKKLGGATANTLTIATTSAQTIDGLTTEPISVAGGFREVISDGANWLITGGKVEPVIVSLANLTTVGASISIDASMGSIYRVAATASASTCTLAVPTNPIDADAIAVELTATVATTLTINASILPAGGLAMSVPVAIGKKWFGLLRHITGTGWYLLASSVS